MAQQSNGISLKRHHEALTHVCELIDYYKDCKEESEFSKLVYDEKFVALIALQAEIFETIRNLEKR